GEFHAAWPWDLPPKGHYNTLSSGNILDGSYLQDFFIPSLAVYRWSEAKWENWLMESATQNGENYEVKLKQGLKRDDGKEVTSARGTTACAEGKAAAREVAGFRPVDPPAIGPYKLDKASVTAAQLTMVKNAGGLFADKVTFDKIVV